MKKKMLFILLCLSFILPRTIAQSKSKIRYGVMGGLNVTSYTLGQYYTSDWKLGVHGGVFAQLPIRPQFGIEADLLYSQKGGEHHDDGTSPSFTLNLNYLNLPILFYYHLVKGLSVQAGGEIGLRVAAKAYHADNSTNVSAYYQSFDKAVAGGLVYDLPAGVGIGIRYIYGFKPITKNIEITDSNGNMLGSESLGNNMAFQLSLRYTIKPVKRKPKKK